jgi:competence protein ComEC
MQVAIAQGAEIVRHIGSLHGVKPAARPGNLAIAWPLGFGAGAAIYFAIPVEPWIEFGWFAFVLGLTGALAATICRFSSLVLVFLVVLSGFGFGAARAQWRTHSASQIVVASDDRAVTVHGWLESIEAGARNRSRLVIRVRSLDNHTQVPRRIRVLADPGDLVPGDDLSVRAVLAAPSRPAVPGSYDFAFHAYFTGLGGSGYAVAPVARSASADGDTFDRGLARLRWQIADHIRDRLPGRKGSLAAALLAGDRSGLSDETSGALRGAGLGHLLAISGMHMALIAGGVFYVIRVLAAAIIPWARRSDAAKPAAVAAFFAALIYLLLSGGSIPTQRAFIMTIAVLGAVLLARRALSMHTLAVAMSLILIAQPEAIMTAGFQMSFAAVAALIAGYEAWRFRPKPIAPVDRPRPVTGFMGGLAMTSVIAGFATSGFAMFHFHRMASFGLLGNLIAMPVFSILVMPAGALALVLMPFGLDGPALWVMGIGLDIVYALAAWVAALPGAMHPVAAAPGWVLAVYSTGFVLLVAGQGIARLVGMGLGVVAAMCWVMTDSPDMFVTEDAVVVARFATGEPDWSVSTSRRARFDVRVFLEQQAVTARPHRAEMKCDQLGCSALIGPLRLSILEQFDEWQDDCARADLIVSREPMPVWLQRGCASVVLDGTNLMAAGGALIWLDGPRIQRIEHVERGRRERPWSR